MKGGALFFLVAVMVIAGPLCGSAAQNEHPIPFGDGLAIDIKPERMSKAELKKLASLGIHNVRIGINWPEVEKRRGEYSWDVSQPRESMADDLNDEPGFSYDGMIRTMHHLGFHMSATLYFGNSLYTGAPVRVSWGNGGGYSLPAAPRTPESIDAFAAFAAATAQHYTELYGEDSFTWLIWNEPDTDGGFPPKTDGEIVGRFITATCQKIKEAVPKTRVMAPALGVKDGGAFRMNFIRDLFASANPLSCLDAFTVHPYRSDPPETVVEDYVKLAAFLEPWQPARRVPLAAGEWGYPLSNPDEKHKMVWRDYTPEEQAALMLRMYLVNLAARVPLTVLYEWRNSGQDEDNDENTYGMNTFDGREKPAMTMWRVVMPLLKDRVLLVSRPPIRCDSTTHFLRFGARFKKEKEMIVAWTETASSKVRLAGYFESVRDVFGNMKTASNGENEVALSGIPLLIEIDPQHIEKLSCSWL